MMLPMRYCPKCNLTTEHTHPDTCIASEGCRTRCYECGFERLDKKPEVLAEIAAPSGTYQVAAMIKQEASVVAFTGPSKDAAGVEELRAELRRTQERLDTVARAVGKLAEQMTDELRRVHEKLARPMIAVNLAPETDKRLLAEKISEAIEDSYRRTHPGPERSWEDGLCEACVASGRESRAQGFTGFVVCDSCAEARRLKEADDEDDADPAGAEKTMAEGDGARLIVANALLKASVEQRCDHSGIGLPGCETCEPLHLGVCTWVDSVGGRLMASAGGRRIFPAHESVSVGVALVMGADGLARPAKVADDH